MPLVLLLNSQAADRTATVADNVTVFDNIRFARSAHIVDTVGVSDSISENLNEPVPVFVPFTLDLNPESDSPTLDLIPE